MNTISGGASLRAILEELDLQYLWVNFEREKITTDVVEDMTMEEFISLGLGDFGVVEELKQACQDKMYSDMKRLKYDIRKNVLETLLEHGFKCLEIATILNVSVSTLYRRMGMFSLSSQNFSDITDDALDEHIAEIYQVHDRCGEVMLKGFLTQRGVKIPRQQLRDAIHRVDPQGPIDRRRRRLHRRIYHVDGPNRLWHVDGNHKLVRWGFVVHGGIDGYSRLPVFLRCSTNNYSATVLDAFHEAVQQYGVPLRVRTDAGGENVLVWRLMEETRGADGVIVGKSTHNQRIERLWRDVFEGCLQHYYHLFYLLEDSGCLNHLCPIQLFALHYVFLPRINTSLSAWLSAWICHKMRTTSSTPLQMWVSGQLKNPAGFDIPLQAGEDGEDDIGDIAAAAEVPQVEVMEPIVALSQAQRERLHQHINPLQQSNNNGIDIYFNALECITQQNEDDI